MCLQVQLPNLRELGRVNKRVGKLGRLLEAICLELAGVRERAA